MLAHQVKIPMGDKILQRGGGANAPHPNEARKFAGVVMTCAVSFGVSRLFRVKKAVDLVCQILSELH